MHIQRHLFGPTADTFAHQPELFPLEDRSCTISCDQCGEYLVTTECGYLACPSGCGRLRIAEDDRETSGSWFEEI